MLDYESSLAHLEERLELHCDIGWVLDRISHNVVDEGVYGVCVERWLSNKQLIQDHPQ